MLVPFSTASLLTEKQPRFSVLLGRSLLPRVLEGSGSDLPRLTFGCTMSDSVLLLLILFLLLCLVLTVGGLLVYSGLLSEVVVKTGAPPIRNVTVAYKFKQGAYKESGTVFTETCSIGPNLRAIGVFYDDSRTTPPEKCRCIVGSVLCEGEEKPDEELLKLYEKFGFKVFSLPEVSHAVTTTFPYTTSLSHVLAVSRVYRELASYIENTRLLFSQVPAHYLTKFKEISADLHWQTQSFGLSSNQERKLCAFPFIEIFHSDVINYMAPLSRQMDFYVPEIAAQFKTDGKDDDSDEDRGTDITGADSHSDVSSVSGGVPWDSRETSLAASTAASLASSLPLRDIMDSNEDDKRREHSDRGSNDSVGSGSSFEELDMDQEELEEGDGMESEKEKGVPGEGGEEEEQEEGAEEEAGLVAKRKFLGDGEE